MKQTQAYQDGVEYLRQVSLLLPDRQMVDVMQNLRDRVSICHWMGKSIAGVNFRLQACVSACDECFKPIDRRSIQIFAIPFATTIQLDGFCNIAIAPTTILVDVGRVYPSDWLALVAHEYAHAHLGYGGHDREYAKILNHLCLGLGLPVLSTAQTNLSLHCWPPYQPKIDPLAFWRGDK